MSDEHRVKISNSNILNALIEHTEGRREMAPSQVAAGLGLLRKVLPDLTSTELSGEVVMSYVVRLPEPAKTPEDWLDRYAPPMIEGKVDE